MMNVQIICVGKLKEKFYLDAVKEYEKRLAGCCKLQILELAEERLPDDPSPAQIQAALAKERDAVKGKIAKGATVVALCIEGKELSSTQLAEKISSWGVSGVSQLTFLVGSSYGMHPELKELASFRLSMSPMTFPHHLARVMLLEQIYRAFKINEGSKYHK
jgi:23S rRNA (pseudouridine1915-N3)-methyltransferase